MPSFFLDILNIYKQIAYGNEPYQQHATSCIFSINSGVVEGKKLKKTSFLFVQFLISIFRFIENYFLGVIQKVCLVRRGGGARNMKNESEEKRTGGRGWVLTCEYVRFKKKNAETFRIKLYSYSPDFLIDHNED